MIYEAINRTVFDQVPRTARRLLDIGCGSGALGLELKRRQPLEVVGVTHSEDERARAGRVLDRVVVADLESLDFSPLGRFDGAVASHVLEHLRNPEAVLARLRNCLLDGASLVVALPNALHHRQRLEFALGRFRYTDGGLMDRTHYRFFDWQTARQLVASAGFRVVRALPDGGFPGSRCLGRARAPLDRAATTLAPGLFAVQFVLVAVPD